MTMVQKLGEFDRKDACSEPRLFVKTDQFKIFYASFSDCIRNSWDSADGLRGRAPQ